MGFEIYSDDDDDEEPDDQDENEQDDENHDSASGGTPVLPPRRGGNVSGGGGGAGGFDDFERPGSASETGMYCMYVCMLSTLVFDCEEKPVRHYTGHIHYTALYYITLRCIAYVTYKYNTCIQVQYMHTYIHT
jgi:hypothetical protein